MEKVICIIGYTGPESSYYDKATLQTPSDLKAFLSDALEISHRRVDGLFTTFKRRTVNNYTTVALSYRQMGRYAAYRKSKGLMRWWKALEVVEHVEDDALDLGKVVELRPSYRTNV